MRRCVAAMGAFEAMLLGRCTQKRAAAKHRAHLQCASIKEYATDESIWTCTLDLSAWFGRSSWARSVQVQFSHSHANCLQKKCMTETYTCASHRFSLGSSLCSVLVLPLLMATMTDCVLTTASSEVMVMK